jgi:hypothetical protein
MGKGCEANLSRTLHPTSTSNSRFAKAILVYREMLLAGYYEVYLKTRWTGISLFVLFRIFRIRFDSYIDRRSRF